jgi:hypothetical protein
MTVPAPLKITIYGTGDEIKREVTRSIVPWGILERAIDIQEEFANIEVGPDGNPKLTRDQIKMLTDFVVFMFDDTVTPEELKRGASIAEMFALYKQVYVMVGQSMPKNPTPALTPKQNLQKVKQGKRRRKK